MNVTIQILVSGITLGSMYAISTVSLSLIWGPLNMLNMAQGALLTFGGYVAYVTIAGLGLPPAAAIILSIGAGALVGLIMHVAIVRHMLGTEGFEVNVVIATVGVGTVIENLIQRIFGAYPLRQPLVLDGGFFLGATYVPNNTLVILSASALLMLLLGMMLKRTRAGRAIRAVSLNRDAAQLMGVPVQLVYAQVLMIAGGLSAASGIMLSTITTLAPTMGYNPMLKAFIICVVAGLGNVSGALAVAFLLGLFEALVQFELGVRFAFPAMLLLVVTVLIWRPYGLFGHKKVARL